MAPRGFRDLATFEKRVNRLGERLGPIRVVVQPERDDGFLAYVLGSIDPGLSYAFDFRHDSWAVPEIDERLAQSGSVRVGALEAKGSFRYLRFRDPPYDDAALDKIAAKIRPFLQTGIDVYGYFRHEDEPTAPHYAEQLRARVG